MNKFYIFILFLLTSQLINSKIYVENPTENYYQELNKKFSKKYKHEYINDDNELTEKPTSSFDFLFKNFKKQINAYFYSYNDYIDGLNFIWSKYKYLFRRFSGYKVINKTIPNINKPKYEKYFNKEKEETETPNKNNYIRNLDEKNKNKDKLNKKNKLTIGQSYPYNNTDLYNSTECPTIPDLKVYYYNYFCNGEKVPKSKYEELIEKGEKCEFYNNTQKICICPIHYISCKKRAESRIRCMAKEVIVNDEINLTKYYDTFYEEYFKTPILENAQKIFNFSLKLKCGMPISDDITGGINNFYLSNEEDNTSDFDIISTMYNNSDNGTQYTKEEINNKATNILEYFIKKKNLVMLDKPKLSLKFSIIDQHWVVPYRIKKFVIDEDIVEDLLSGKQSLNFTVDINDIIENEIGIGPFSEKNCIYPYFDKGDLHFFEITMEEKERQMRFYPFRGEIKK